MLQVQMPLEPAAGEQPCLCARTKGVDFCYMHKWGALPELHRAVRHWGMGGLLDVMAPGDLSVLLEPAIFQKCAANWALEFLFGWVKDPAVVRSLPRIAPTGTDEQWAANIHQTSGAQNSDQNAKPIAHISMYHASFCGGQRSVCVLRVWRVTRRAQRHRVMRRASWIRGSLSR